MNFILQLILERVHHGVMENTLKETKQKKRSRSELINKRKNIKNHLKQM